MSRAPHIAVLAGTLWLGAAGCKSEITRPQVETTVSLTATPTSVAVGADVTFRFDARATELEGLILAYGDGTSDSIDTFLAQTASGSRQHPYAEPGSYRATVTAFARDGTRATDSVRITVLAAAIPAEPR